jgi:hypothetical protein
MDHFLEGYAQVSDIPVPVHYIADRDQRDIQIKTFQEAEIVLFIFPLYTDCMPGVVKEFLEDVFALKNSARKKIGFLVQSGFPEALHSTFVERYLKKFSSRMNYEYLGTVIRGGVEGIQIKPFWMKRNLFRQFKNLGKSFAEKHSFSPLIKRKLRTPYRLSPLRKLLFRLMSKTGLINFYWDTHLKQNGAYKKRFDKPFAG